jgi:quercetin dioxygenase-like cupin family protein
MALDNMSLQVYEISRKSKREIDMFERHSEAGYRDMLEGVEQKTLAHGEKTLMSKFYLQANAVIPMHSHPHEQTGYMITGHAVFTCGAEKIEVREGDSWCIPGDVEHGVEVISDSVILEVFSPVREDYLPT